MAILITGGAGYIGSHTCIELLNNNYKIIVVDNLSNSSIESLNRVKEITGKQF
ncbi:NAD-dependent epimerase/dehydratase family protein, partial [Bacillus toyonensis]